MASLENVLANIPGLAGYEAQGQMNRQKEIQSMQQAQGAMTLMDTLRKRKQEEELKAQGDQFASQFSGGTDQASQALQFLAKSNPQVLAKILAEQKMKQDLAASEDARIAKLGAQPQPMQKVQPSFTKIDNPEAELASITDPAQKAAFMQAMAADKANVPLSVSVDTPQQAAPVIFGMTEQEANASIGSPDPGRAARAKLVLNEFSKRNAQTEKREMFDLSDRRMRETSEKSDARMRELAAASDARIRELAAANNVAKTTPKPMTELQRVKFDKQIAGDFNAAGQSIQTMSEIKHAIKTVRESKGLSAREGYTGYLPAGLQGQDAMTAQNRIDTLKGKVTQMGKAMATLSGAIGPMAVQEWKIVSDAVNAIDPRAGNFEEQLANIEAQADGAINRIKDKYEMTYSDHFETNPKFKTENIKVYKSTDGGDEAKKEAKNPSTPTIPIRDNKTEYAEYVKAVNAAGTDKELRKKIDDRARERGVIK